MNKKRIALITTWFPPKRSVAVNRMHAFAKYLSQEYEVVVFTDDNSKHQEKSENFTIFYNSSKSFINSFKHQTNDSWLRHNFISLLNVTKSYLGYSSLKVWKKDTLIELKKQHTKTPFDLIISSFSPFEPHAVAAKFVKENNIPWIADMRDEMSKNPFATKGEIKQLLQQEQLVHLHAKAITSVSYPILDDFRVLMPNIRHFEEIRNGFDHDLKFEPKTKNKVFTIGYFGKFYGQRKPDTFFEALENVIQKNSISVKVNIVGAHKTFTIPNKLRSSIDVFPPYEYLDAVTFMSKMDANLLVHPSGMHKGVYTGKVFDYISSARTVIGVIDKNDVAAELINNLNCGYVADFYDIAEIEKVIMEAYTDWKNNVLKIATQAEIDKLHRENEVQKLIELIEKIS